MTERRRKSKECLQVQENISALFDGELDPDAAEALLERIHRCARSGCGDCARLLDDLEEMECLCKDVEAECDPPGEVVEDLRKRLLRFVSGRHD